MTIHKVNIRDFGVNISDSDGNLRNINEIISELERVYNSFDTSSMSEHTLYLEGQKNMLGMIIEYLKKL